MEWSTDSTKFQRCRLDERAASTSTLLHHPGQFISRMSKRNLLICFDAFGTLFKPKRPVEEQYTAVAHKFGLGLISDGTSQFDSADVRASFRKALKNSAKEFPNYGRAVGMGATAWWTQVSAYGRHGSLTPFNIHRSFLCNSPHRHMIKSANNNR